MFKALRNKGFLLGDTLRFIGRDFAIPSLLLTISIVFCLLAGFVPVSVDKRRASEEKSSEYIQEPIDLSFRLASCMKGANGSGIPPTFFNLENVALITLPLISGSFTKPKSVDLSHDKRSIWSSDLSPPQPALS